MIELGIAWNDGPRPVEQEITELFAGLQVVPTRVVSRRTDQDLEEGGYPLGDSWQPMLPLEEEE